jgi:hypothetical protein
VTYPRQKGEFSGRQQSVIIYLPNRSAQVMVPASMRVPTE